MSVSSQLEELRADPTRLQDVIYAQIAAVQNGTLKFVDPTNPVALCIEATAFSAAALDVRDRNAQRATYPSLATTWDDIYRHMSDEDFIGRFSNPSIISMRMIFSLGELKNLAEPVGDTGVSKIVIPKHTKVNVGSVDWILQYPIEIRFMPHGGIRVVYDTAVTTPLQTLESNLINWSTYFVENDQNIEIEFPMYQFKLDRYLDTLSANSGYRKSYSFADQFYYCRVYGRRGNGTLVELKTVHANEVYDQREPTAILQVESNRVTVSVPLIYFTNGLLPGGIQIDVMTTKGALVFNAADYVPNVFAVEWGSDHNSAEDAFYAASLPKVSQMAVYSLGQATGGTNGFTFEEQRERTVNNANKTVLPITDKQLESALRINGYEIIKSIDNVVRRIYLASRSLNAGNSGFSVGAGVGIETVEFAINQFIGQPLVRDNGQRVTFLAGILFNQTNGGTALVTQAEANALTALPKDRLISTVLQNQYVFTPISYVLDMTNNGFDVRAYDFENPTVAGRQFVMENDTTGVSISTTGYLVEQNATGYRLTVLTSSDEGYKELSTDRLFSQIYFRPEGEIENAVINGRLVGLIDGEYVWQFDIQTGFDVDADEKLWLTNFAMFVAEPRKFKAGLAQQFGIIYGLVNVGPIDYRSSAIDSFIAKQLVDQSAIGVTHELFTLNFGYHMRDFWTNGRTVPGNIEYLRYNADVPLVHKETVFLRDAAGDIVLGVGENDVPTYTIVHAKGTQVVIGGEPQWKARKNDLVRDEETNELIPINTRKTLRHVDFLLVDGVYYFATGEKDVAYRKTIATEITAYLKQDLAAITPRLLEKTEMYLYPKKTIGSVTAFIQDGQIVTIPAGLSFTVRYWLNEVNYSNESLRESIRIRTHEIINELLQARQFGTDDLIVKVTQQIGSDIIAVDVDKIGPNKDIPNYTMFDDTARCSVKRKLKALPDATLRVVEDITVEFILHRTA